MSSEEGTSSSSIKDTIIMFIAISPQTNFVIWGVLLPYYFSYLKHFNSDISFNQCFGATCFFFVGLIFCSWIYPSIVSIIGLRNMILLSGSIYALNAVAMCSFSSFVMVCFSATLIGFCIKIMYISNMLYFSSKYESQAKRLIGVANLGFIILSFIWSYLYFALINPDNEIMTEIAFNGSIEERYFKWEVAQRFRLALNLHGLYCFIISVICSRLITNPERFENNTDKLFDWFRGRNKGVWEDVWSERDSIDVSSLSHSINRGGGTSFNESFNKSQHSNKIVELLPKEDEDLQSFENVDEIVQRELRGVKFWILFSVSIIKFLLIYYFIDASKTLGLIILKNDALVTRCYNIVSFITGIVSSFIVFMLEKIGMINGFIITSLIVILVEIYFMYFTEEFPLMFILFMILSMLCLSVTSQINNLILINFYSPEVTLQLQKVYDFNLFVANAINVAANTFLFQQSNLFPVFFCLLIFDVIGLTLTVIYLKPMEKERLKLKER